MTNFFARAGWRRAITIAALLVGCVAFPAVSTAAPSLTGWLGRGAKFPAQTMMLSAPAGVTVDVPHMYIWENGGPVDNLSVTPLTHPGAHQFGVELVIDQSDSMSGAPLAHALDAARALAAQRAGNQELGVIGFNSVATTALPLTSDPSAINHVLSATPWTSAGTRILPAVSLALRQLQAAKIANGAVILLSDGAATGSAGAATVESVAAAAHRQHVPIITIGLRDRAFQPGVLQELAHAAGGRYIAATGAQLPNLFAGIGASLTHSYLIRYKSIVRPGRQIAVKVHVDGVPAMLHLNYYAQAPAPAPAPTATAPAPTQQQLTPTPAASLTPTPAPTAATQLPAHVQRIPTWKPVQMRRTFWSSSAAPLAVAGICALLLVLALTIVLSRHPARRTLRRRVGTFIEAAQLHSADGAEHPGALERLLVKRRWWPRFVEQMQAARIQRSPIALVKRSAVIALVAAVLLALVAGSPIFGLPVLIVAPFIVRWWVSHLARRQRKLFAEQDLAGAMRAGRSFVGAITAVAETSAEPVKGELERALSDERLGLPLEDTLEAIARRMEAKDMEQIALIAALNRNSGSNVAEALDRVADGARDRADLAREIKSLTGQARMSMWVLSGLPVVMLIGLSLIAPEYSHPLLHTTLGIILLAVAGVMVVAGWGVMRRIVNPEA
jgi:tight adherence protein B